MPRLLRYADSTIRALNANGPHQVAARKALVHFASDSVYSFIPKNGCSTMRLSLAIANGCLSGTDNWTWIHANNDTFAATLRDLATAKFTFVILRCPFSRLASAFLDKIVSRRGEYWALHHDQAETLDSSTLTFRGFVRTLARPGLLRFDQHWRPQVDFLVYQDYDAWYALEDFATARAGIEDRTGMQIVDARPLTGHSTSSRPAPDTRCYADVPIHDLDVMKHRGILPRHASLYDEELCSMVKDLYEEDFEVYVEKFGSRRLTFPDLWPLQDHRA